MSAESEFFRLESEHILKTVSFIEDLLEKQEWSFYETIAMGKLLQDIYMGVENIVRCQLKRQQIPIPKTEDWHRQMLQLALKENLLSELHWQGFKELLSFRHAHIHGYGHMLKPDRLRELAAPVPALTREYLSELASREGL